MQHSQSHSGLLPSQHIAHGVTHNASEFRPISRALDLGVNGYAHHDYPTTHGSTNLGSTDTSALGKTQQRVGHSSVYQSWDNAAYVFLANVLLLCQ